MKNILIFIFFVELLFVFGCKKNMLPKIEEAAQQSQLASTTKIEVFSSHDTLHIIINDSSGAFFEDLCLLRANYLLYELRDVITKDSNFDFLIISNKLINSKNSISYNYKMSGKTSELRGDAINMFANNQSFYEISGIILNKYDTKVIQNLELLSQSLNSETVNYRYDKSVINLIMQVTNYDNTIINSEINEEMRLRSLGVVALYNEDDQIVALINDIFKICDIRPISQTDPVPFKP